MGAEAPLPTLLEALVLGGLAGLTIPLGGLLAAVERLRPGWLEEELRHAVLAFGAGVLVAAVALVLVPEGSRHLGMAGVALAMAGGSLFFMALDRWLAARSGERSQLMAMLLDFLPEAAALGALLGSGAKTALLLALLMALQNLPEGFNAYRELRAGGRRSPRRILAAFAGIMLLGPLAALGGLTWLVHWPAVLGGIMLAASGGILYLVFQDIAPQVPLQRHWAPPLGAVSGFLLGLLGQLWIGG
ncbi:ZIP family metal transporter [Ectothiorhodospira mobilis]|uniref:ZIP family metal transporter n=1 Tax=Ectothiorhodospira mobilis TaxID=195064 RepID=UPI0019048888|nr:divalent cation transporter [Ectothiorhodospira mobilis]MBK1691343.1 divalent cation transporter [Ectothiorhodospira mobilis]